MQKVQLESKDLLNALVIAAKVAPPIEGNVTLIGRDGKFIVNSMSELSRCETIVPAKIEGKNFEFALPLEALRDASKGRDQLEMSWDGTLLLLRSAGGYKADLLTLDPLTRDELDKVECVDISLSAEQSVWLKSTVATVALRPTMMMANFMPVTVKLTAKGAFVACYDNSHMAFVHSAEIHGDLVLTLPLDKMQTILDTFTGSAIKLRVSSTRVEIRNKLTYIAMNLPAMEDEISADDVVDKARLVTKAEGVSVVVDKVAVTQFLDNARSVMGKERVELIVQAGSDKLKLAVKTVRGNVSAIAKAKTKKGVDFKIDLDYFDELVRKTRGAELSLSVVGEDFISSKFEGGVALVTMNQD